MMAMSGILIKRIRISAVKSLSPWVVVEARSRDIESTSAIELSNLSKDSLIESCTHLCLCCCFGLRGKRAEQDLGRDPLCLNKGFFNALWALIGVCELLFLVRLGSEFCLLRRWCVVLGVLEDRLVRTDGFFTKCSRSCSIPLTASFASCIKLSSIPEIRSNVSSCSTSSSSSISDNNAIAESGLVIVCFWGQVSLTIGFDGLSGVE